MSTPIVQLPATALFQHPAAWSTTFSDDREHFGNRRPTTRTAIRMAHDGEFEQRGDNNLMTFPVLWVLVVQASPAMHVVVPIWRGSRPWFAKNGNYVVARSDAEITAIVQACGAKGGVDQDDWHRFIANGGRAA